MQMDVKMGQKSLQGRRQCANIHPFQSFFCNNIDIFQKRKEGRRRIEEGGKKKEKRERKNHRVKTNFRTESAVSVPRQGRETGLRRGREGGKVTRGGRTELRLIKRVALPHLFSRAVMVSRRTRSRTGASCEKRKQREGRSTSQLIGKTPLECAGVEHPFDALHSGESPRAERVAVGMVWAGTKVARGW